VLVACSPQAPAHNATVENVQPQGVPQTGLQQVPLTIHSATGDHRFTVEVAATVGQQEEGMMFRRQVPPDTGMIFHYAPAREVAFWMKNTLVPLDIIFIRTDGTIARIITAKPLDETPLPSGEPVATVLEIAGGRAAELGIREGDVASWPPLPL